MKINMLKFSISHFIKFNCIVLEKLKNKYVESYKEMFYFVAEFYYRLRPILVNSISYQAKFTV